MKTLKRITALLLCGVMLLCMCSCGKKEAEKPVKKEPEQVQDTVRFTEEAPKASKSETVFVSTDNSGAVINIAATDWIHTDKTQVRVTDVSELSDITNVKTNQLPAKEGDKLVWNMDTTDVYYSGITDKEPPVKFTISYFLDGKEMTAEEIAGKSGHAEIKINVENNCFNEVEINGEKRKIYLPVLAAGGTILQESEFSLINAEGGFSIGDGTKQITVIAGAPGLSESLGMKKEDIKELTGVELTDEFVISADTTCFETTDFYFAVIPFCSLDVNLIAPDSVSGLVQNLGEIKKIFSCLENIDISSIIDLISGGTGSTDELIGAVNSALELYNNNEAVLKLGSKYLTGENLKNLSSAAELLDDEAFLKGLSVLGKSDIGSVAASLPEVADSLQKLAPILKNEVFSKALEILSSPVMVKFFEKLPELAESLASIQKLAGSAEFINAINTLNDPSVAVVFQKMPELMKSFETLEPVLGELQKDFSDPQVQNSINNLPETMKSISSLIDVVQKNSGIIDRLVSFASDENVKEIIEILRAADIDTGELEKKLNRLTDNAQLIADNAKEWISFGKDYGTFTGSTDKQETNVVFIYNTPPIEKRAETVKKEASGEEHWYERIINLFKREE